MSIALVLVLIAWNKLIPKTFRDRKQKKEKSIGAVQKSCFYSSSFLNADLM